MLTYSFENLQGESLYEHLYRCIRQDILSGKLAPGEKLILSTGYLAAMDAQCSMDIQTVKGAMNVLFGSESVFNTVVTGPGKIYIQTKPIAQVAAALKPFFPTPTTTSSSSSN